MSLFIFLLFSKYIKLLVIAWGFGLCNYLKCMIIISIISVCGHFVVKYNYLILVLIYISWVDSSTLDYAPPPPYK